jgi:hypothetical protein
MWPWCCLLWGRELLHALMHRLGQQEFDQTTVATATLPADFWFAVAAKL